MRLKAVLDSDGLIKLYKAGVLEALFETWECLIPRAVYMETVQRGMKGAYPEAVAMNRIIPRGSIRDPAHHPRAAKILKGKKGLGQGEMAALHLYFVERAHWIISDDTAFLLLLQKSGCVFLPPALVLVELTVLDKLTPETALEALERIRSLIRAKVYQAVRRDLETLRR
jgi:hypothetical protein